MPTWIWIVIAVVVVLAIALGTGSVLARRRRISLKDATPPPKPVTDGPPAKGGYKAGGSISFSSGGSGTDTLPKPTAPRPPTAQPTTAQPPLITKPLPERTETDGQPGVGDDAAIPRDSPSRTIVDVALPDAPPAPVAPVVVAAGDVEEVAPDADESETATTTTTAPEAAVVDAVVVDAVVVDAVSAAPVTEPAVEELVIEDAIVEVVVLPEVEEPPATATTPAVVTPPTTTTPTTTTPTTTTPTTHVVSDTVTTAPLTTEEIAPTAGRLNKLRGRLSRSQNLFGKSLLGLLGAGTLDEDSWTDVEDTLLMADLGAGAAAEITARLRAEVAAHGITDAASARALLRRVLIEAVGPDMDRSVRALPHDGRPSVLLIVGVNGTGKTTTTGKLARVLVADGRHVVLGAADTFRAAAAEQLVTWGERAGAVVVRADAGTDPASVAFDAVKRGIADGADAVLIDTAGRLHTKTGLMDELGKVKRVIEKQAAVDEILLVLDATTGQNGLVQATVFADVVDITGIVLTKLDGTAKGGIVVAVQRTLNVPVKLVGLGEGADDLAPFEPAAFVDALLGD